MWRAVALAMFCCVGGACAGCAQNRPAEAPWMDTSILTEPANNWFGPHGDAPVAPTSPNDSVRK
jgi:hypothetical protein